MINVLIACEESQVECLAFRSLGFNAYSCDIQKCSGGHPEWHINGDVLKVLNPYLIDYTFGIYFTTMDGRNHVLPGWDLVIAHPPCTYLCNAGACKFYSNGCFNSSRYEKTLLARKFFEQFLNCSCEHVAIENPKPWGKSGLPKHNDYIEPYMFGDPYSKRTYFWLKGLPPLYPTLHCLDYVSYVGSVNGSKKRSKSFKGIASAMADQWGNFVYDIKKTNKKDFQ